MLVLHVQPNTFFLIVGLFKFFFHLPIVLISGMININVERKALYLEWLPLFVMYVRYILILARKCKLHLPGFYTEGGEPWDFPPPPEILKFSMVFGQDCVRSNLRRSKNKKISFGDMPPDHSRLLAR